MKFFKKFVAVLFTACCSLIFLPSCVASESGSEGLVFSEAIGGKSYLVKGIGDCTDSKIEIPANHNGKPVTGIKAFAFCGNATITEVNLPEGVKTVESSAFERCENLTAVRLPSSLTTIESKAFSSCENLKTVRIEKKSSLKTIGDNSFEMSGLEEFVFPAAAEIVGNYVFMDCASLTESYFEEGTALQQFGYGVYWGCSALVSAHIPPAVTYLGWANFKDCASFERAYVGTEKEFGQMTYNSGNDIFKQAKKYYYSETEKGGSSYWHYENGKIVVWD